MEKNHKFQLRLSDEEYLRLKCLAIINGVRPSDAIRKAINDGWEQAMQSILSIDDDTIRSNALLSISHIRAIVLDGDCHADE